ncbi:MAG: tripartite tricarboxylate transporter TctB family protein [Oscillospiraceae bacterium]|nr:tripartite tricarboxylate transporter TctB family protein [Oscillospiraceae bacterium]
MENREIEENASEQEKERVAVQPEDQNTVKRAPGEVWFLGLLFLITLVLFIESRKLKGIFTGFTNPGSLPQIFILVLFLLIILELFKTLFREKFVESRLKKALGYLISRDVVSLLIMVVAYVILLPFAHFIVTSSLFLFGTMYLLDRQKPIQKILVSAGVIAAIQLIFHSLMQVVLP